MRWNRLSLKEFHKNQPNSEQGIGLIIIVMVSVVFGIIVLNNLRKSNTQLTVVDQLRQGTQLSKLSTSSLAMMKKLVTPPWKGECGLAKNDSGRSLACPVLFPEIFACTPNKTDKTSFSGFKKLWDPGSKAPWSLEASKRRKVFLEMPLVIAGMKSGGGSAAENLFAKGIYNKTETVSVYTNRLFCETNNKGEVINNILVVEAITNHKGKEAVQRGGIPIVTPPPHCLSTPSVSSVNNIADNSGFNNWKPPCHEVEDDPITGASHEECDNSFETEQAQRPKWQVAYPSVPVDLTAWGIFVGGSGPFADKKNLKLPEHIDGKTTVGVPNNDPICSPASDPIDISPGVNINYPTWLVAYLNSIFANGPEAAAKAPDWVKTWMGTLDPPPTNVPVADACNSVKITRFNHTPPRAKELWGSGCPAPVAPIPPPPPGSCATCTPPPPGAPAADDFAGGVEVQYHTDGGVEVTVP